MGNHDLYNQYDSFDKALGCISGTLGFRKFDKMPIPTTTLTNPINDYASSVGNVLATIEKTTDKYDKVLGCISSGINVNTLPKNLQNKIAIEGGIITKPIK